VKAKSLCKFSKDDIEKHFDKLAEVTYKSSFLCTKCARSANSKKWLCKPKEIK